MSKKIKPKVDKPKPQPMTAEMLLRAIQDLKDINDRIIAMLDDKLKDFHNKLNDINVRIKNLEKINGVTYDESEPDVSGGPAKGGARDSN